MADPTAGGELSAKVFVGEPNSAADTARQVPPDTGLTCAIAAVGRRTLAGSLIALGTHPVPWA